MPLIYRLEDYARYRERVGDATIIDVTRRTDPARIPEVWQRLRDVVAAYGAPWVVQVWTKDPAGVLRLGGDTLRALVGAGVTLAAQVTVTGLAGTVWEPHVPPDGLQAAAGLAALAGGPEHLAWRYDPVIPGVHTPERFRALTRSVADLGVQCGIINLVAAPGTYVRVDRRLAALLPGWADGMPSYDAAWRRSVVAELVAIASEFGIRLSCCAENADLGDASRPNAVPGLGRAACGDHAWFSSLSSRHPLLASVRGSRPGCGCAPYFDVGSYGCWARCHRCVYCYAG
jgi:hypothetical protein